MRKAVAALAAAIIGLVTAIASGVALVPRVRLVEVVTVIAAAIASGVALGVAVAEVRQAKARARAEQNDVPAHVSVPASLTNRSAGEHPDRKRFSGIRPGVYGKEVASSRRRR
jgi:hypothetical protein